MAAPSKVTLKLLIDKKAKKVLFAEAGKEAVDFICSILSLPVGKVTWLLSEQGMVGCLSNLYKSIENLNQNYVQPSQRKDNILKPPMYNSVEEASLFLFTNKKPEIAKLYCGCNMCPSVAFVEGDEDGFAKEAVTYGFVKEAVTYMVMDDLAISPTSAISTLFILNELNVDVRSLEEKVVELDMDKGLKLLKASFRTKKVLTEVFLQAQVSMEFMKLFG